MSESGTKIAVTAITLLLIVSLFSVIGFVSCEQTLQTIRIKTDGSIEPINVPIQRDGNVYRFTADICGTIVVEKDNITIDGAGYTLFGTYNGTRTDTWWSVIPKSGVKQWNSLDYRYRFPCCNQTE